MYGQWDNIHKWNQTCHPHVVQEVTHDGHNRITGNNAFDT